MNPNRIESSALCAVGVVVKAFGVKGEVKVDPYSRSAEELEEVGTVRVGERGACAVEMTVSRVSRRGKGIYIQFKEISDRGAAKSLIGHFLFVDENRRRRLRAGEYFVDDVIGMSVYNLELKKLGIVKEVLRQTAQDMYVVETGRGNVIVPAVRQIVKRVDVERRTMTIDPPEGLFDGPTA